MFFQQESRKPKTLLWMWRILSFTTASQALWPIFLISIHFMTCSFYPWISAIAVILLNFPFGPFARFAFTITRSQERTQVVGSSSSSFDAISTDNGPDDSIDSLDYSIFFEKEYAPKLGIPKVSTPDVSSSAEVMTTTVACHSSDVASLSQYLQRHRSYPLTGKQIVPLSEIATFRRITEQSTEISYPRSRVGDCLESSCTSFVRPNKFKISETGKLDHQLDASSPSFSRSSKYTQATSDNMHQVEISNTIPSKFNDMIQPKSSKISQFESFRSNLSIFGALDHLQSYIIGTTGSNKDEQLISDNKHDVVEITKHGYPDRWIYSDPIDVESIKEGKKSKLKKSKISDVIKDESEVKYYLKKDMRKKKHVAKTTCPILPNKHIETLKKKGYCGHCWNVKYLPFKSGFSKVRDPYNTRSGKIYGPSRRFLKMDAFVKQYGL